MTPLQKCIAEIEAKIAEIEKIRDEEDPYHESVDITIQTAVLKQALLFCIEAITANLEYERGVIVQAWIDGTYGIGDNAHDYFTKTYGQ